MAYGLAPAFANQLLNTIASVTFTPPVASFVQLHIGDPGAAGTANVSSVTARQSVTWSAPAAGSMSMSNTPSWGSWTGVSPEVIVGLSFWSAVTLGTFIFSQALASGITVQTGFPLSLSAEVVTIGSVAA